MYNDKRTYRFGWAWWMAMKTEAAHEGREKFKIDHGGGAFRVGDAGKSCLDGGNKGKDAGLDGGRDKEAGPVLLLVSGYL